MNIIVFIKQVPETSNVKISEDTGTMIRDGVESIINPLDLYSIETALELKEKCGGNITVISMGPETASKAIREAISMGCDDGILLSGKEFAGSDTWATAYALSEAAKNFLPAFDIALCGERATDGDTGQVGPEIAALLDIPIASYVSSIEKIESDYIEVERLTEFGYEKLELKLPALLTVVKEISYPRLPTLRGKQRAKDAPLKKLSPDEIGIDKSKIGLNGSTTRVVKIETPKITRGGEIFTVSRQTGKSAEDAVNALVNYLESKEL